MKCLSLIKRYAQKTSRCGTECGAIANSAKKTDAKMTIAATITNTTPAILVTLILNYRPAIHTLQNA